MYSCDALQAAGLYNGVVILQDRETGTYWNHMSGAAVHGPLKGSHLPTWSVRFATASRLAQRHPAAPVVLLQGSQRTSFLKRMFIYFQRLMVWVRFLPPLFTRTMPAEDARLPRFTLGLGVVHDGRAMFFPAEAVHDAHAATGAWPEVPWPSAGGRALTVVDEDGSGVLAACWRRADGSANKEADAGVPPPQQYWLRWYGFSLQYPEVEVYDVQC